MNENNLCPCCGRHCDLKNPHCPRGEEYLRTGVIPEHNQKHEHKHSHGHRNKEEYITAYKAMDTDNKLIMNLRDLGHMLRFLFEGKGSQKRILIILNEAGSITQHQLTERLGIKPGSASEVLAKLEDSGLIQRTPSTADRRTTDIQLTETGKKLAEEAAQNRKRRHQEMFSCLSEEEKTELLSLLEKINSDWEHRYNANKEMCAHEKHCEGYGHHGPHHGNPHHKH